MLRRLIPLALAAIVAVAGMVGLVMRPATGVAQTPVDYVIIAGAPGLRWDDLSEIGTPALWRLAEHGSIGSLSVRSAANPTCPVDGWLTLGAGNYAAAPGARTSGPCPADGLTVDRPDKTGARVPAQESVVRHNRENLPWGAVPGALSESVRCTVAVGPGAAIAAARPFGRVDRYAPALPSNAAPLLASCVLGFVDLGTVTGTGKTRAAAVARADSTLARILAARPDHSLILVAGLSDTDTAGRLHVAIADGPGWEGGWLTSTSTGRPGYVQLIDLAPTALAALNRSSPQKLFAGQPASSAGERPTDLAAAVARPADADREARARQRVANRFFVLLGALELILFVVAVPLLWRARPHGGPGAPRPAPPRLVRAAETLLTATALAIPAALIADAIPWWRADRSGIVFGLAAAAVLALLTAGVRFAAPFRRPLGPLGLVAALAAGVVAVDVLTGARLQLNGVAGYSALEGARYAGIGTVGLGVLAAGALLLAGHLAQQVSRSWRPTVVVIVGGIAVVLVGSPYLGSDAGGAIALTAGVSVAAAISTGGWLTFARLAWATLAGVAVTSGFAVLDLRRPAERRGTLGTFLTQLSDGTGGPSVHRAAAANGVAFVTSPLTILAIAAAAFVWLALMQEWGGLKRLFGLYPAMRAAFAGLTVAVILGGLLNSEALTVAGAAAAVALPLATIAALRVLHHAMDRTQPPLQPDPATAAPPACPAAESCEPAGSVGTGSVGAGPVGAGSVGAGSAEAGSVGAGPGDAGSAEAGAAEACSAETAASGAAGSPPSVPSKAPTSASASPAVPPSPAAPPPASHS
ncbi:hypothetical protein [Rhizomonospora bruguierae]|uniref:hypothetical protein n=1 Tax=Rhizomonospora bruguierae TaxID=1581705 RepID=UPI001BCCE149|nr:hypothetical protein [Micromonospora sp. NBRC 107566]